MKNNLKILALATICFFVFTSHSWADELISRSNINKGASFVQKCDDEYPVSKGASAYKLNCQMTSSDSALEPEHKIEHKGVRVPLKRERRACAEGASCGCGRAKR